MRHWCITAAAAAAFCGLAAPASAQIFGVATAPLEEKKPVYVADASQIPPATAVQCYVILALGLDNKDVVFRDEEIVQPLISALRDRVNAELKRTNQPGDIDTISLDMRRQVLTGFTTTMFYDAVKACGIAGDASLVKYRSQQGGQDAMNCYAYLHNRNPADPDVAFLEYDLETAFVRYHVVTIERLRFFDAVKGEFDKGLAGAQAAQLDTGYKGCAAKVRPYLRKIAYSPAPQAVRTRTLIVGDMNAEMDSATLNKIHLNEGGGIPFWDVPADGWAKLVGSVDAGNAMMCTSERPLRAGKPAGSLAPVELLEKLLAEAGVSAIDIPVVIAAGVSDRASLHGASTGMEQACATWGAATAKRYGATYFAGTELKMD